MKSKKENVVIYADYDEESLNYSIEREEMLKKYCDSNKYNVIKIIRNIQHWKIADNMKVLLSSIINENEKIDKLIIYDINEVVYSDELIATLGTITDILNIELETIRQGIVGKNLVYSCSVDSIDNELLKKNKEFIISESQDLPF